MSNTVKYRLDLDNPSELSKAQQHELANLTTIPEEEIELNDIPELDDEFWEKAVRNPFYKPKKASTTVRIDTDVLNWLKSQGKGYQTRINQILRNAMLQSMNVIHEQKAEYKTK